MQSMALVTRYCCVVLAVTTYLAVAVQADCSKDCTSCAYHMGQATEVNSLACTLECEGKLPTAKAWGTCKELLQTAKDNSQEADKEQGIDTHLLAKKYGGFMKRYGGFMKKKMDELYHVEPEEESNGGEILAKKYGGFMKKEYDSDTSDLLRELLGTVGDPESGLYRDNNSETPGEVNKRYGGFMRDYRRSSDTEDEGRELQKRYGGFMRRVGRPEWWQDYQKRYGGFMRRFADSLLPSDEDGESYSKEIPEMDKRYGGFMRF
ncbi:proenkephalin-A [Bufo gargarizans]|uniref:proenkephalin-A n=1 Tax=Bufo gargarizans TaxID=30331 RepID=UPI001CF3F5AD|nr:proenkephalin-A [Bufo gargarizans]